MENKRGKVNRTYKDRLFKLIFKEKKDLMQSEFTVKRIILFC